MIHTELRALCAALSGLTYDALHDGGVLRTNEGSHEAERDWHSFEANPCDFIVRLPNDRLDALVKLINERVK